MILIFDFDFDIVYLKKLKNEVLEYAINVSCILINTN